MFSYIYLSISQINQVIEPRNIPKQATTMAQCM
jgi:hypothetical protein